MSVENNIIGQDIETPACDFSLQYGGVLKADIVRGRLYGQSGAPLIIIPGGISASRFIADGKDEKHGTANWWGDIVGYNKAVDLARFQVLGFDVAPNSENCNKRHCITTKDQARRLARLLDFLDVKTAHSIIGMSYGGMIGMAFAALYPERLAKLCIFGAAHRPWPFAVGLRSIGRRIIEQCSNLGNPLAGLKLARELAMTTYRSAEEFSQRFNALPDDSIPPKFDVGNYLEHCGQKYPNIMSVNRFLALSESIDLHHIDATKINCPTHLIAVKNDQLAPVSEMQAFASAIFSPAKSTPTKSMNAKSRHVRLDIIDCIYGHDSFLKATDLLAPIIADFCKEKSRAA